MDLPEFLPINTKVYINELKDDCGIGTVEGVTLYGTKYLQVVRFKPPLTSRGEKYLSSKITLTPNGTLSRMYCLPSQDLVPVGSYKSEYKNARRKKRAARGEAT